MRAAFIALAIAVVAAAVPAQATHKVPQEHPTITEAVAAAANGDTILVSTGVYHENVVIGGFSDLTLKAKGKVIISPASGTALTLNDCGDCSVTGFRFTDCGTALILHSSHDVVVSKCRSSDTAVGFRIEGGNDNTLSSCHVDGTNGGNGLEIDQTGGDFGHDMLLSRCKVKDTFADGILALGSDNVVDRCTIQNAGSSGIVVDDLANCAFDTISKCRIIEAQVHGIVALADQLLVSKCRIIAPLVNGIRDEGCTDCEFASCAVSKAGEEAITTGALSQGSSIHDCKLSAPASDGLFIQGTSITVDHNKVSKGHADGIGVHSSSSTFTDNRVSGCAADGFVLVAADHNTLSGNKAHGSGGFDLDDLAGDPTNVVDDTNKFGTTGP